MRLRSRLERKNAAEEMTKLDTYRNLKDYDKPTALLRANLTSQQRSISANFLCGILLLEIETGRYAGKKRPERLCLECDLHEIESESHFMFECPLYEELWEEMYVDLEETDPEFCNKSSTDKL